MNSNNLKELLEEYKRKRDLAEIESEHRKEEIYTQFPKLNTIDSELSKASVEKAKLLLTSGSSTQLNKLNSRINKLKHEKEAILKTQNIDFSYFLPKYECKYCEDTGYIVSGGNTVMCSCLKQRLYDLDYNSLNSYNIKNHTFDTFDISLYSSEKDSREYNSDVSPKENIQIIKEIAESFIDNFDSPEEKNLLFFGKSGLGKTFLSSCIANELIKKGKTVLYQTAPVMLDLIIDYRLRKT